MVVPTTRRFSLTSVFLEYCHIDAKCLITLNCRGQSSIFQFFPVFQLHPLNRLCASLDSQWYSSVRRSFYTVYLRIFRSMAINAYTEGLMTTKLAIQMKTRNLLVARVPPILGLGFIGFVLFAGVALSRPFPITALPVGVFILFKREGR